MKARRKNRSDEYLFGSTPERVALPPPHDLQRRILAAIEKYTFIVLICGRRFGKSFIITGTDPCIADSAVYDGDRIGIFTPVSNDAEPLVRSLRTNFDSYTTHSDNTRRIYDYVSGGCVKFFSAPNTGKREVGRGDNFRITLYDEFQKFMDSVSRHHVTKVAMPWMLDTPNSKMLAVGTANGRGTHMHELARKGVYNGLKEGLIYDNDISDLYTDNEEIEQNDNYITIRMPSHANPHLDAAAIKMLEDEMTALDAMQEIYCKFVQIGGQMWCYAADDIATQNRVFKDDIKINWNQPLYLGFDFNKNPQTGVLMQLPQTRVTNSAFKVGVNIVKEFTTPEGVKAPFQALLNEVQRFIYAETGKKVGRWHEKRGNEYVLTGTYPNPFPIMVTGDASGNTGDGRQRTPRSYFEIAAKELGLNMRTQFRILSKNPFHAESFVQINTLFEKHAQFFINRKACPLLYADIFAAVADDYKGIDKKKYDPHKLDALRYLINTFRDRISRVF